MRILIAEDSAAIRHLLRRLLVEDGHEVAEARHGREALLALKNGRFDALVTDWMMPEMDGLELLGRMRAELESPPPCLMVTSLSSPEARDCALQAGADDYLTKPYQPQEVLSRLANVVRRHRQPAPARPAPPTPRRRRAPSGDRRAVVVAASTGGPEALRTFFAALEPSPRTAYFLVLHGPVWMLKTFTQRLQDVARLPVRLAEDRAPIHDGEVLVSPGDVHMVVDAKAERVRLRHDPPENFVRPAADPLLRSVATAYGEQALAVVLTGMGRDASVGCQYVRAAGGRILVQDPATAAAPSMPRTVVEMGIAEKVLALTELAAAVPSLLSRVPARTPA